MNNSDSTYWAVVPAAGIGRRMGGELPKQYQYICGKTILEHTLDKLLAAPGIGKIVVALGANDAYWPSLPCAQNPRIVSVVGGAERADSVLCALQALAKLAQPSDWVLVHDAARPCVRTADITHLIEQADSSGAILASPVSDTLKKAQAGAIQTTVDRSELWAAQTPQMFPLQALREALEQAQAAQASITDEASAMERLGWQPKVVPAARDNIKITQPEDLPLAELILSDQLKG